MSTESQNFGPNVDLLRYGEKEIYLVGTAHLSQASTELVDHVVREIRPDTVAVELCESRYRSLKDPDRWKNTDLLSVIREGRGYVLLAQLLLTAFQKKLGNQLKIKPGAEMMRAVAVADEVGAATVMADREIRTTLKRTWSVLSIWSAAKLIATMLGSVLGDHKIDEAEIERLKNTDALEGALQEFSEHLPSVRVTLIDERDQFLAAKIREAGQKKIVAVVGAGHVPGIKRHLNEAIDVEALSTVPPKSLRSRIGGWLFLAVFVGFIIYGFVQAGAEKGIDMMQMWFWVTGFAAAFGSALALAHPLTVLSAFIASPFTTLHPLLASGWVAALVEAMIRKPRVSDFETIADDITSVRGAYRNRISRILLVMILTNVFGSIGAVLGLGVIAGML
ncbi:MAG: TraB/GumN family protein [Oligoflexia bacterium]|nr:TraB/GumN family protein [Oligoflexia bacterium]